MVLYKFALKTFTFNITRLNTMSCTFLWSLNKFVHMILPINEHVCWQVPGILTSLQKSVQALLQGKTQLPNWFTHGVKDKSLLFTFRLEDIPPGIQKCTSILVNVEHNIIQSDLSATEHNTFYHLTTLVFDVIQPLQISLYYNSLI